MTDAIRAGEPEAREACQACRHFGNFNKTYGTLGAAVALMTWLYWTGFAMLVGAELNSELAKISKAGKIEEKHEPPAITRIDYAT